ncbi:MAG: PAS domain S-box protein [Candidatus Korobacteraceae bacterium]|jgi:PAS domain S-box-containing protein
MGAAPKRGTKNSLLESLSLLHNSDHLGVIIASDELILDANDAFLQMIGYTRAELEAGELRWRDITPPEQIELSVRAQEELRSFGVCAPFEKEYLRRDGSRLPCNLGAVRMQSEPLQWAAFVVNLTDQRRLDEIEQRNRELQARTRLVNNIAHEINNPLMILSSTLYLLQRRHQDDDETLNLLGQAADAFTRIGESLKAILATAEKQG